MTFENGQSQSSLGVGGSSTNETVVIKATKKKPWNLATFRLCEMSSGKRKARYNKYGIFKENTNSTRKTIQMCIAIEFGPNHD